MSLDTADFPVQFYPKRRNPGGAEGKKLDLQADNASDMDPDTARQLFDEGAFMFFLDVPEKTEFGIDCTSWNVGEKFKGIKMVPPGIHFIYYSAVSKDNTTSPRTGFFYKFKSREVLVRRWDPRNEGMSTDSITEEEQDRLSLNVRSFDEYLGAYPYSNYRKWVSLTRWITEDTIDRLSPVGPNRSIFSVQQLESAQHVPSKDTDERETKRRKSGEGASTDNLLPDMKVVESTRIRFSDISLRPSLNSDATAGDITRLNMDRSAELEALVTSLSSHNPEEILGEIQFAFVCFLIGQVYDAFEQWKKLVAVLCCSENSMHTRPGLFCDFIGLMYFQLREVPRDFFVDIVTQDNFLTRTLQSFFAIVEMDSTMDGALRKKAVQFRRHLQKQFKWDFSAEIGDYAPTIVDL